MGKKRLAIVAVIAAAAALPAPSGAAVSVGHSAWEWGNPRPQGSTLWPIEFRESGYAGGQFGTVLRSDDGGETWIGLPTGVTDDLNELDLISRSSFVVAGGCALRRSDDSGESFVRLPWTARDSGCSSAIAGLSFPNGDVGYVLTADGGLLRSTDGGRSWSRRTAVPGTPSTGAGAAARDILFTSPDDGLAVIGGPAGGAILRTTDGGSSWTPVQSAPAYLQDLDESATSTPLVLFAAGAGGLFYRSTDGGQTWEDRSVGVGTAPRNIMRIDCATPDTCIAAKERGDELYRTTDGGTTWTPVTPSTERAFGAAFASPTRAVAVGENGVTVVSNDAGATWARVGDALAGSLHALRASSSSLAFALGSSGTLARTLDSGETWRPISVPTSETIVDVSFPSANIGYALDFSGTLFRTENGGTSWAILDTGSAVPPRALVAVDEATVVLVGPRGMRRSNDAGQEFAPVADRAVRRAALGSVERVGPALFAHGRRAAAFSLNGGRSWRRLAALPTRSAVVDYDWVTTRAGYALDASGRLWHTRTAGRRWVERATTGTSFGTAIAFSSLAEGYLLVGGFPTNPGAGYLLRTLDGGRTWRPQLVARSELTDVVAPGGTDFALSAPRSVFRTSQVSPQDRDTALSLRVRQPRRGRGRPPRRQTIQVVGRLTPPQGGERVVLSSRSARGGAWTQRVVTAASNGSFTVTRTIRGPTLFVAQWEGDDERRGAGSRTIVVRPR